MSNKVTVSNVPKTVSLEKVKEFFSFSGKVDQVNIKSSEDTSVTYEIVFASSSAVSSAILLDGADLDGQSVHIIASEESNNSAPATTTTSAHNFGITPQASSIAAVASVPLTEAGVKSNEKTTAAASNQAPSKLTDIDQESKPKTAIVAELLSHGYTLKDHALTKAIDLDKKHGISDKFKSFMTDLDNKYHVQDKVAETNTKYGIEEKFAKGRNDVGSYFDKVGSTDKGKKVHNFYTGFVNQAQDIHQEAKRLSELRKANASSSTNTTAAATGTATSSDAPKN